MKHIVVYFKEDVPLDCSQQFTITKIEDGQDLQEVAVLEATRIIKSFYPEPSDDDLKENLLHVEYFQVDSRVVPVFEKIIPGDLETWEDIVDVGGIERFSLIGVLDVLKAFKTTWASKTFTEEQVKEFRDSI